MTTAVATFSRDGEGGKPQVPSRIYVGIDVGYKSHVAAAIPVSWFNRHKEGDRWKRAKTLPFSSDASGFRKLQHYLEGFSTNHGDFLILLEPTGGYYAMTVIMYLMGEGYPVLEIDNTAVKDYREKVFGTETKTDAADARLMARMGFLHEMIGEEFSIQPVHISNPDEAALKVMTRDYVHLQKEITRRQNQLQQVVVVTFPELKTFFKMGTAIPAARALLMRFPSPKELSQATEGEIEETLKQAGAHVHAKRADELRTLAVESAGLKLMPHHQWRQGWLLRQLAVLVEARDELLQQITQAVASHPYTPIIESLPIKSPIWTAILIGVIGNVDRFANYGEFKAYAGFFPKTDQSGTSLNRSRLADRGVRLTRRVLGQMVLILITPSVRNTAFREYYQRLLARGMKPTTAQANVAAKLAVVLYGMLKAKKPYDENKHRRALGLPELPEQANSTPLDVTDAVAELSEDQKIPSEEAATDGETPPHALPR